MPIVNRQFIIGEPIWFLDDQNNVKSGTIISFKSFSFLDIDQNLHDLITYDIFSADDQTTFTISQDKIADNVNDVLTLLSSTIEYHSC